MIHPRQAALQSGARTYFTGMPCVHGHVAPRYTSHTTCTACNLVKSQKQRDTHSLRINATKRRYTRTNTAHILLASAKRRAKVLQLAFGITVQDIAIPEYCPVLGIELRVGTGKIHAGSPTLDRSIPAFGYVRGNIEVISHRANLLKNDASIDELKAVLVWLDKRRGFI